MGQVIWRCLRPRTFCAAPCEWVEPVGTALADALNPYFNPPPPHPFSQVFISRNFKSNGFVSAHSKGFAEAFFVSAYSKGLTCQGGTDSPCLEFTVESSEPRVQNSECTGHSPGCIGFAKLLEGFALYYTAGVKASAGRVVEQFELAGNAFIGALGISQQLSLQTGSYPQWCLSRVIV